MENTNLDLVSVIKPKPEADFIESPYISNIIEKAIRYIKAGIPVHLSGPTGCGKTTLALHTAHKLGKPVILINGDEEFSTSSLVGGEFGYRKKKVVDKFVSRVYKSDESYSKLWIDDRLTSACRYGFILIYNEFTRSRPEANNILLSVLEEGLLELPGAAQSGSYVKVHPEFAAIFTSNPEEYAGVFRSQDALMDRMITISMEYYDEETEILITAKKAGISYEMAGSIVRLVRRLRESGMCEHVPTLRSTIMIARASRYCPDTEAFKELCFDVLTPKIGNRNGEGVDPAILLDEIMQDEIMQDDMVWKQSDLSFATIED